MVRSLVVSPHEDMRTWLKYASLCGKSGRLVSSPHHMGAALPCLALWVTRPLVFQALAHKTLVLLLGVDPSRQLDHPLPTAHPQVTYAYMKNMWKSARKVCSLPTQQRPSRVFPDRKNQGPSVGGFFQFHSVSHSRVETCVPLVKPVHGATVVLVRL